ncbi:hypothetical protein [Hydrogenovibrio crunogenus]|uniref:hypothetical protein n=1 Tax=Hydrogenovibrio crunogenus TaxID=39765 RepID=UPI0010928D56|nr:hypothetical protein [Hydrogenovibrio crunogenus]
MIELMVVVVILAVLVSIATLTFTPNDSVKLNQQTLEFKGALQQACDEAIFTQKIQALVPSKKGSRLYFLQQGKWQIVSSVKPLVWLPGMSVDWQVAERPSAQAELPGPGWLCWPTGEILPGSVTFQLGQQKTKMSWTPLLKFTVTQENAIVN